jgi:hypothetical protein
MADIGNVVLDCGPEQLPGSQEPGLPRRVNRDYPGASPLHFEAKPAIPCADIENPLPIEILRN